MKSLFKQYVMNDYDTFMKIYNDRFNSNSTIKFDFYINKNQCFFVYDKEIMKIVSKIREAERNLNLICQFLPKNIVDQYIKKSLIEEIEYTNKIEGVILTKKEINDLIHEIENNIKTKNRFYGIVKKYYLLREEKLEFNNSLDIRKIYDEMLYKEIEEENPKNLPDGKIFRKDNVHVFKTSNNIVHTGVFPEEKIIEDLEQSLDILNNKEIDVLIRIAIFHYLFGYIHPFYDGNGRINRFISSYLLCRYFNEILGFRLSITIYENLSKYLNAFQETNDSRNKADLSTFVYEFLNIIYKSLEGIDKYIEEKNNLYEYYISKISKINNLTNLEKELLCYLIQCNIFEQIGITKSDIKILLNKKNTVVTSVLSSLKEKELCIETRNGRYFYYLANLDRIVYF